MKLFLKWGSTKLRSVESLFPWPPRKHGGHPVLDHHRKKKKDQGLSWDFGQNKACYTEEKQGKDIKIFHPKLFTGVFWVHVPFIITIEFHTKKFQNISNTESEQFYSKIWIEMRGGFDRKRTSKICFTSLSITENMLPPSWFKMEVIYAAFLTSLVNLIFFF